MKKSITLLVFFPIALFAQYRVDYGVVLGPSNYLGDIGNGPADRRDFIFDLQSSKTNVAAGFFIRERIASKFAVREALTFVTVSGDDKLTASPGRRNRNLNFKNTICELALTGEFYFFEMNDLGNSIRSRSDFRAYAFGGVAAYYSNPKGRDINGGWVALQPLRTEGQPVAYKRVGIAIPVGVGLYFTINRNTRISWDLGWRMTFTDYLDDISGNYPDFTAIKDTDLRKQMSNRAAEQPDPLYIPVPGSKRGDPSHNDHYLASTVGLSHVMRGHSKFYRNRYSWPFGSRKFKKRRIRSKF